MELVYICRDYDEWFHCSALTISVYINDGWHVLCALARERNRESETETLPLNRRKSVTLQTECRVCLKRWRKKKTTKHWTVNRSFNLCVFEMWPSCRITRIARYSWKTRLIQMQILLILSNTRCRLSACIPRMHSAHCCTTIVWDFHVSPVVTLPAICTRKSIELCNLYGKSSIVAVDKSNRIRYAGHLADEHILRNHEPKNAILQHAWIGMRVVASE